MTNPQNGHALPVVVTGGARGLGAAYVAALLDHGYAVVIADRVEPTPDLQGRLDEHKDRVLFVPTDVASPESVLALREATLDRFKSVWGLVNNAAVYQDLGSKTPFDEISIEDWERVLRVNLTGPWLVTKTFAGDLRKSSGRVVNTGSSSVHMGVPNFAHYLSSKGGVHALTRGLARELGPSGVTVNAIAPGLVSNDSSRTLNDENYLPRASQQRAIPRDMQPDDLVSTLLLLLDPTTSFLTGQTIVVDGGATFV
ncbi:SDR family NAD(P)-dependent oxidoreductase [Streptomyces canus]|uniref:SDR family NAD(P)-dependent oxidoreductase n=1 Tax=Streptomyces canus TaxID=58343 RepID=UPI00074A7DCF|nr:SDR family oxidoreductase [Streptomyces canus]KUN04306.1 hypothetical protein AQI96_37435 [Streptomyces canus]